MVKNMVTFVIGGLALVASIIAIIQVSTGLKDTWVAISKLESNLEDLDQKLEVLDKQIDRSEAVKSELIVLEERIRSQSEEIGKISDQTEVIVQRSSKELNERISELETSLARTPVQSITSGAEIRKVDCLPLGERVLIDAPKSYDFCDTQWTFQISKITKEYITISRTLINVPNVIQPLGPDDKCAIELLEIVPVEKSNFKLEVRGRCQP